MRILLVEDDRELSDTVGILLKKEKYDVDFSYDGEEGLYQAQQAGYDVILLDRMLPGVDGLSILSALRRQGIHTPILMLTALGATDDKVDGLDAGADDYLAKPFEPKELMARIRAMLRRTPKLEPVKELRCGDVRLDDTQMCLTGPKGSCILTKKENDLLAYFIKRPDRTISRNQLFAHIWGPCAEVGEANLDSYMCFVRRRLAAVGSVVQIKTVRGVGLRLETAEC